MEGIEMWDDLICVCVCSRFGLPWLSVGNILTYYLLLLSSWWLPNLRIVPYAFTFDRFQMSCLRDLEVLSPLPDVGLSVTPTAFHQ